MCDYYENSFLTISTATSADSSIPFLGSRDERWLPVKLELTNGLITEDVYAQRIASKPEEEGKLFTRAWAWQEAAMSSRTIYFTPSELIWECPKHVVPQRYIPDRKASDRLGFSSVLSMLRFRLNPYVHRDINSSVGDSDDESPSGSDDLINISSPGSETRMWEDSLGIELCWAREHRGFRDLMTLPTAYVAPSWSWASIPGGVTNRVERTISVFEPQSTITEAYSDVPGLNLFGRVTAGHLVMRGQVAEAMLTCDDPHTSLSYKISGPADKWEFLPDSILVSSNGNVSRAKQGQKLSDFRAKIFCLYIGLRNKSYYDDKSAREHLMLVLGQSEDVDVGSSYCRLGLAYSKSDSLFNEAPTLDVKLM
ncbi:hypothetical protein NW762_014019 [Fusarium torreyae]|uniref:Heterokaryon incompatibility domain-containing protein n=1 Tax=Fusarium torreyae TaxID=1237075 RepID=A0A9W8RJL0_9HYPO|nr:hypothetical protein NW762_014019 [Fusarium torreyae]